MITINGSSNERILPQGSAYGSVLDQLSRLVGIADLGKPVSILNPQSAHIIEQLIAYNVANTALPTSPTYRAGQLLLDGKIEEFTEVMGQAVNSILKVFRSKSHTQSVYRPKELFFSALMTSGGGDYQPSNVFASHSEAKDHFLEANLPARNLSKATDDRLLVIAAGELCLRVIEGAGFVEACNQLRQPCMVNFYAKSNGKGGVSTVDGYPLEDAVRYILGNGKNETLVGFGINCFSPEDTPHVLNDIKHSTVLQKNVLCVYPNASSIDPNLLLGADVNHNDANIQKVCATLAQIADYAKIYTTGCCGFAPHEALMVSSLAGAIYNSRNLDLDIEHKHNTLEKGVVNTKDGSYEKIRNILINDGFRDDANNVYKGIEAILEKRIGREFSQKEKQEVMDSIVLIKQVHAGLDDFEKLDLIAIKKLIDRNVVLINDIFSGVEVVQSNGNGNGLKSAKVKSDAPILAREPAIIVTSS